MLQQRTVVPSLVAAVADLALAITSKSDDAATIAVAAATVNDGNVRWRSTPVIAQPGRSIPVAAAAAVIVDLFCSLWLTCLIRHI